MAAKAKKDSEVGIVVVSHRELAAELIATAVLIVGAIPQCTALSMGPEDPVDELRSRLAAAIDRVNGGRGVIVLTDMFGGTPSNLSLSFLNQKGIEVVTGVNLPMLIKVATARHGKTVEEVADLAKEYGRKSISRAGELLSPEKET